MTGPTTGPQPGFPRALSDREREVLEFMLNLDDPRLQGLRDQVRSTYVIGRCECGCATIDLALERPGLKPVLLCSPVTEARGESDPFDPEMFLELLLFLDSGWLDRLEIVYYGDAVPTEFPQASYFDKPQIRC